MHVTNGIPLGCPLPLTGCHRKLRSNTEGGLVGASNHELCHHPDGVTTLKADWSVEDGLLWAAAADACRYKHAWQKGDVLIVDNMLTMHGRESYVGARKLGVVLTHPVDRFVSGADSRQLSSSL
jgi:hypothetical protein